MKVDIKYISLSRPEAYPNSFNVCHTSHSIIKDSITRIAEWFPGIEVSLALKCKKCHNDDDFIVLPTRSHDPSNDTLECYFATEFKGIYLVSFTPGI